MCVIAPSTRGQQSYTLNLGLLRKIAIFLIKNLGEKTLTFYKQLVCEREKWYSVIAHRLLPHTHTKVSPTY